MASERFQRTASEFLREGVELMGERVGSLVGAEVQFRAADAGPMPPSAFASRAGRKKCAVILMENGDGSGHAMVFLRISEAILMAGTLLMMPPLQIKEFIRSGEMEQDISDAFSEVANIIYGGLNEQALKASPDRGKLRNEGVQLVDPSREADLASLWPSGETFGAEMAMTFPGQEPGTGFVIYDTALLEQLLGVQAEEPAGTAPSAGAPTALLFGHDDDVARDIRQYLSGKGIETARVDSPEQAVGFLSKAPVLLVAEFQAKPEEEISRVCRAASEGKNRVPVVGVAASPTRETILLARRTGVRTFLVHPFTPEALRTKMEPLLATCVKS